MSRQGQYGCWLKKETPVEVEAADLQPGKKLLYVTGQSDL